jgi:hypothetical protein
MGRAFRVLVLAIASIGVVGCSTAAPPTASPSLAAGGTPGASVGGPATEAARLCTVLTEEDFAQLGFPTRGPNPIPEGPGSAICEVASGVGYEVYTHDTPEEAAATYRTIVENVPMDGQPVQVPGAAEALLDLSIGEDAAGIAGHTGSNAFFIGIPASDDAESRLLALAGLLVQRAASALP